jgi:hypothetical protein
MKATLSTRRIAAALLLSPIAAAMVATPAVAQPSQNGRVAANAQGQSPVIERFTVRALSVEPGRDMRFRVLGSPGANAQVDIPKVVQNVRLREVQPGVYEGSYTIRLRDDLSEIDRAVATLRNCPMTTTARIKLEGEGAQWPDRVGPRVVDITPNDDQRVGERGRTEVSARFRDDRSGVDVSSVRLRLDGEDVTRRSRVTGNQVSFEANLRQGRHHAELVVRDRAGNVTRTAWNFVVNNDVRGNNGVSLGYGR